TSAPTPPSVISVEALAAVLLAVASLPMAVLLAPLLGVLLAAASRLTVEGPAGASGGRLTVVGRAEVDMATNANSRATSFPAV
ncbi:MAG: hypothetical protein ACP5SH_13185, partial [Syntrophobacteraceae bacterium]